MRPVPQPLLNMEEAQMYRHVPVYVTYVYMYMHVCMWVCVIHTCTYISCIHKVQCRCVWCVYRCMQTCMCTYMPHTGTCVCTHMYTHKAMDMCIATWHKHTWCAQTCTQKYSVQTSQYKCTCTCVCHMSVCMPDVCVARRGRRGRSLWPGKSEWLKK